MEKIKVLFLCTGNSARSQMAEAFLNKYGEGRYQAYSAGLEPQGIHPLTIKVMEEIGIALKEQRSKSVVEYMGKQRFAFLVTVCSHADKNCPAVFPEAGRKLHYPFDDPAAAEGIEEARIKKFREVRDQIEDWIKTWLKDQDFNPNPQ